MGRVADEAFRRNGVYASVAPIGVPEEFIQFGSRSLPILRKAAESVSGLDLFLTVEIKTFGPQFVCACLTLAGARELRSEGQIALMSAIMHEKRGELLGRLGDGVPWPESGLNALAKFNTTEAGGPIISGWPAISDNHLPQKYWLTRNTSLRPSCARSGNFRTESVCGTCFRYSRIPRLLPLSEAPSGRIFGTCPANYNTA
jgi:hypothetical protein